MVKKQNDNIVLDFGNDDEISGGKLRGILKSINKGTKKLGVNKTLKQAENQAKKIAKNVQKEAKQAEKKQRNKQNKLLKKLRNKPKKALKKLRNKPLKKLGKPNEQLKRILNQ